MLMSSIYTGICYITVTNAVLLFLSNSYPLDEFSTKYHFPANSSDTNLLNRKLVSGALTCIPSVEYSVVLWTYRRRSLRRSAMPLVGQTSSMSRVVYQWKKYYYEYQTTRSLHPMYQPPWLFQFTMYNWAKYTSVIIIL
jgi:hypothetical protein